MIEQLISKFQSTSEQTIREWWGPEISSEFPNIIDSLEWDSNGCYQIGLDHIVYHNFAEGRTQRLIKNWETNSWYLYQRLYLKAVARGTFRVEVPIKRELVQINGETWEFSDVMRPGKYSGEAMGQVPTSLEDAAQIAECYYNLYETLIELAAEEKTKIPVIGSNHIYRDDQGFYFTLSWNEWDTTPSQSIEKLLGVIKLLEQRSSPEHGGEYMKEFNDRMVERLRSLL